MGKKLFSWMLTICMLLTMLPTMAWAEGEVPPVETTETPVVEQTEQQPAQQPDQQEQQMMMSPAPVAETETLPAGTLDISNGSILITDTGYAQGIHKYTAGSGFSIVDGEGNPVTETAYTDPITITGTSVENSDDVRRVIILAGTTKKTITLENLTIDNGADKDSTFMPTFVLMQGTADLVLLGENNLTGADQAPAVQINKDATLTIKGTGNLTATGRNQAAGIGAPRYNTFTPNPTNGTVHNTYRNGGNLIIESGTVNAVGNEAGAGIGASHNTWFGDITINSGNVTVDGKAGINTTTNAKNIDTAGDITINGGMVDVTINGKNYAGIGGGAGDNEEMKCTGDVTITGGEISVDVTKNANAYAIRTDGDFKMSGGTLVELKRFASSTKPYITAKAVSITGGNINSYYAEDIDGYTLSNLYFVNANGTAVANSEVTVGTWKAYTNSDGIITTYVANNGSIADAQKLPDGWLIGGTCVCDTAPLTFEDTVDTVDVYSAEKTIDVVVRGECNMPIHKSVTTTVKIESVTIEGSTTPVANADTYATYADGKLTLKPAGNEKNYTVKLSATRGGASEVPVTYEIKALASNTGRVLDIAKGAITVEAASEAGKVTYKQGSNEFTVGKTDKVAITGTSSENNIEISTDATIVLKDLSLTDIKAKSPIKLTNNATLNLWLEGENTLTTGTYNHNDYDDSTGTGDIVNGVTTAAIFVESGSTLIIDSEAGTLKNDDIDVEHGGDKQVAYAGSLHAETAEGARGGASAIGGDYFAEPNMACGNITIKGGNVTAIVHNAGNKYRSGAAIGAGWCSYYYNAADYLPDGDPIVPEEVLSPCGAITISGGNVRAEAIGDGRGISSGANDLNITGGVVYATAENNDYNADSRGSIFSYGGTITIGAPNGDDDDVYVYATTSTYGNKADGGDITKGQAAIGGGNGVEIVINSGTVYAESTGNGAAIGGGFSDRADEIGVLDDRDGYVKSITINGGNITTVDASGVGDSQAVGIGVSGNSGSACGPIVINGGTITCENTSLGSRDDELDTTPISVTVGSDATITVENDTSGLTTLTAEGGATINGDTLPESVDSVAIPAGKLGEVKVDETKGTITLPAGATVNGNKLPENMDSVTLPADKLDEVKTNSNGSISLPAGTTVTVGDKETTLTNGGTVSADGTVKKNSYGYYIPSTTPTVTPSVDSSSLNNAAQAVGSAINNGSAELEPATGYTKEEIAKLQKEGKLNLAIEKKSGYASVADKNLIDAAIAKAGGAVSGTVVMYFDITPVLKTDDGKVVANVTDTEKPLTITLDLSAELQKAAKDGKQIAVVRCHDGKTTFLDTKLNAAKTQVTFSSSDFSTYAVVAMEKQTSAQTFDAGIMVYGAMAVLAATGSAVVIGKKRRAE